jgi:hypothetical protein
METPGGRLERSSPKVFPAIGVLHGDVFFFAVSSKFI